jgi:uncharacterized membrane protein
MIVTDLNDRERARYAEQFEKTAEAYKELVAALRARDDDKLIVNLILVSFAGRAVHELAEILEKAVQVSSPDYPPEASRGPRHDHL